MWFAVSMAWFSYLVHDLLEMVTHIFVDNFFKITKRQIHMTKQMLQYMWKCYIPVVMHILLPLLLEITNQKLSPHSWGANDTRVWSIRAWSLESFCHMWRYNEDQSGQERDDYEGRSRTPMRIIHTFSILIIVIAMATSLLWTHSNLLSSSISRQLI